MNKLQCTTPEIFNFPFEIINLRSLLVFLFILSLYACLFTFSFLLSFI